MDTYSSYDSYKKVLILLELSAYGIYVSFILEYLHCVYHTLSVAHISKYIDVQCIVCNTLWIGVCGKSFTVKPVDMSSSGAKGGEEPLLGTIMIC